MRARWTRERMPSFAYEHPHSSGDARSPAFAPRRYRRVMPSPLVAAAERGPLALVEQLIREGALEWQPDGDGRRPLDAARQGHAAEREAIIELLDRPVLRDPQFGAAVAA